MKKIIALLLAAVLLFALVSCTADEPDTGKGNEGQPQDESNISEPPGADTSPVWIYSFSDIKYMKRYYEENKENFLKLKENAFTSNEERSEIINDISRNTCDEFTEAPERAEYLFTEQMNKIILTVKDSEDFRTYLKSYIYFSPTSPSLSTVNYMIENRSIQVRCLEPDQSRKYLEDNKELRVSSFKYQGYDTDVFRMSADGVTNNICYTAIIWHPEAKICISFYDSPIENTVNYIPDWDSPECVEKVIKENLVFSTLGEEVEKAEYPDLGDEEFSLEDGYKRVTEKYIKQLQDESWDLVERYPEKYKEDREKIFPRDKYPDMYENG